MFGPLLKKLSIRSLCKLYFLKCKNLAGVSTPESTCMFYRTWFSIWLLKFTENGSVTNNLESWQAKDLLSIRFWCEFFS
jgi:hypothetical protein